MKNKKTAIKLSSGIILGVIIVLLILINLISQNKFTRLDMTASKFFSLSPATKKLLSKVDDKITVKLIFSKNLPMQFKSLTNQVKDILKDFSTYSHGNIVVYEVPNDDSKKIADEAKKYGIPPVRVNVLQKEKVEFIQAYLGVVFLYEDKKEILPVVSDEILKNLEYEIVSIIRRLTQEKKKVIGFLKGHDELSLYNEILGFNKALLQNYDTQAVTLSPGEFIPDKVDVLIVARPKKEFSEWDKFAIDQFIMKGKKVIFLLSAADVNLQRGFGSALKLKLDDFLKNYGITQEKKLIVSANCALVQAGSNSGPFQIRTLIRYPFFPEVSDLNKNIPISLHIPKLTMAFPSPLQLHPSKTFSIEVLARTSKSSGLISPPFFVSLDREFTQKDFSKGQQIVAAVVKGKFSSYFKGKVITYKKKGKNGKEETKKYTGKIITESPETRLIFIGDGKLVNQKMVGGNDLNKNFMLNAVDWMAQDDSLISIRTKEIKKRFLKPISPSAKSIIKYLNFFGPTVFVIILWIVIKIMYKMQVANIQQDWR
jgi:ABC-2 type transport system permease protein